jgi:predicted nucleotidyltransferase
VQTWYYDSAKKGDFYMSTLKKMRISKGLTQEEASALLGVSLRSYKSYENDEGKVGTLKYNYMVEQLEKQVTLDEEHGILTLEQIKSACKTVLDGYSVKYCILFGSYAKGRAGEKSDVDLLISTDVTGLKFFGIVEGLRNELHKKVDLLDLKQLTNNAELLDEILKDGIKVYEQS